MYMMGETALISSQFDEAAAFLKLGDQGQGRGSAPRPPCIGAHLSVKRSCQPLFPRDHSPPPGCSSDTSGGVV